MVARRIPPPGGGRSARVSGPGGGDSLSARAALRSPHPGLPSAVRPSAFRGGWTCRTRHVVEVGHKYPAIDAVLGRPMPPSVWRSVFDYVTAGLAWSDPHKRFGFPIDIKLA